MGRPDRRRPSYWKTGGVGVGLVFGIGTAARFGVFGADARYQANKALDKLLGRDKNDPPPTGGASSASSGTSTGASGGPESSAFTWEQFGQVALLLTVLTVAYFAFRPNTTSSSSFA